MTKIKTKQNLNRLLVFIAFISGYLISVFDKKYSDGLYEMINNLSNESFLGVYLIYLVLVFMFVVLLKKSAVDFMEAKDNYSPSDYLLIGLRVFMLGFFSGFMTLVGNSLILISIPFQ